MQYVISLFFLKTHSWTTTIVAIHTQAVTLVQGACYVLNAIMV